MDFALVLGWLVLALVVLKLAAQLWLEALNRRNVQVNAASVPEPFKDVVDPPTYERSVKYALANGRFRQVDEVWSCLVLLAVLFTPLFPRSFSWFSWKLGTSAWAGAVFLFAAGFALSLADLPLEWYHQFRLEERFGFNTTSQKLWWLDRLKGRLLSLVLGYPLLALVLKLAQWTGGWWWLWAWAALLGFQILMAVLAPVLIMPLFNKFTPLPEGALRDRLLQLAQRTQFRTRSIQVMDGSKRSRHSNAFFTGFGRFRKIVLFDTLIQQLAEPQLEAVLAHEIGHFKKKHIPKMLVF